MNYLEQAGQPYPIFMRQDSLTVKFTLKEPAKNARLYYLTTGHGGWGGGDEFNQKPNTLYLDGEKVISFVPWRDEMCIRDSGKRAQPPHEGHRLSGWQRLPAGIRARQGAL